MTIWSLIDAGALLWSMTVTDAAADAREAVAARREQLDEVLRRYGASNPRLFGSVAHGDATTDSDIDVLVDLDPAGGNPLMRLAGLSEEFRRVLGIDVDGVAAGRGRRDRLGRCRGLVTRSVGARFDDIAAAIERCRA